MDAPRKTFWRSLGPGLVTGAADDDPSGIASYSQAGAQFGFALTWTMLLTLPFMAAIQIISARIGWQTGQGLTGNLLNRIPRPGIYALVALLVMANTINIAADLAAMGEAVRLVAGGNEILFTLAFGAGCLLAEIFIPYHRYAGYLKFLTLVLLVYVAAAFSVRVPWGDVLTSTVLPRVTLDHDMWLTIVAVFGTTISPYLFFWQASQEAEEAGLSHARNLGPASDDNAFRTISFDTWIGMAFSNLVGFFIIVTTGATLHATGTTSIQTAAQAAEALRPLAGEFTFMLFAAGLIGTGLLAVPVLAGSAAYAVAETFKLQGSLELPVGHALGFYAIVGASTMAGALLATMRIDPVVMLFWTAVINGFVAVPIMLAVMVAVSGERGLRLFQLPAWLRWLGWLAAALMTLSVVLLLASMIPY